MASFVPCAGRPRGFETVLFESHPERPMATPTHSHGFEKRQGRQTSVEQDGLTRAPSLSSQVRASASPRVGYLDRAGASPWYATGPPADPLLSGRSSIRCDHQGAPNFTSAPQRASPLPSAAGLERRQTYNQPTLRANVASGTWVLARLNEYTLMYLYKSSTTRIPASTKPSNCSLPRGSGSNRRCDAFERRSFRGYLSLK